MKTFINFFILTLISISSVYGQSKVEFGAGLSYELHYLDHTTDYSFTGFSASPANLLGLNTYLHLNSDKRFQFRLLAHLGQKDMVFSLRTTVPPSGVLRESIHHKFLSADISLLGMYGIEQKNGAILQPMIGFFSSFNTFYYASWRSSLSGGGSSNGSNTNVWVPDISNNPSITYVGINAGLNYRTHIKGFPIELTGLFYLSPASMFEFNFEYLNGLESADFEGRYHHFTLGMNVPIIK